MNTTSQCIVFHEYFTVYYLRFEALIYFAALDISSEILHMHGAILAFSTQQWLPEAI